MGQPSDQAAQSYTVDMQTTAEMQGPEQGRVREDGTLDTGISDAGWAAITTITGGVVVSIVAPLIGLWVWQRKRILAKRLALQNAEEAEALLAEDAAMNPLAPRR
jgi:hypothetical protein